MDATSFKFKSGISFSNWKTGFQFERRYWNGRHSHEQYASYGNTNVIIDIEKKALPKIRNVGAKAAVVVKSFCAQTLFNAA